MVNAEDKALGAAIRRRREAAGIQQQVLAAEVGLAPGVMGRVELGTRPVRATELRIIARELGTTTDALLGEITPVSLAELMGRAEFRRDAAHTALREYADALVDLMAAVEDGEASDMLMGIGSAAEVREYLVDEQPSSPGVIAGADLVPEIDAALDAVRASLVVRAPRTTLEAEPDDE